jgi:hypothetical protein
MNTYSYPYPDQTMDGDNNYPTQQALDYIKNWSYTYDKETNGIIFGEKYTHQNYNELIQYIESIWWGGEDAITYKDGLLELHTLGWSGNEDIIHELKNTSLWFNTYRATRAGGHYYFKIDPHTRYNYTVTKVME